MAGLKDALLAERAQLLGSNCALNYSKNPLVVLRGEKQWLYDEFGIAYLDCVNNVCHVGHCHPGVVKAASTQLATLQTNSRLVSPAHSRLATSRNAPDAALRCL
jgi:4-aminobutyrate aminotransferase-like enzyme